MTVERWRVGIVSFESKARVENPFLDVTITAKFTGPSGRVITREAYWDGGSTYRVSFAPTEVGQWSYVLSAPEATGLDGVSGTMECVPYTGDLELYKHGFLKVSGQGSHLAYDDDTPFFWLGDTHWAFVAGERWDESNHPGMDSMFRGMVDRRAEQGFTVYQTNLRSETFPGRPKTTFYWEDGQDGILPNISFYQNEVDKRFQYIADKGLYNALGISWAGGAAARPDYVKNLTRYIMARYGAYPMVWTLGGEAAGYQAEERQKNIDAWREIALLIEKLDGGYNNLQTCHYTNERPFADYYYDESWFDFTLNQAGHGDFVISGKDFLEHRKNHPNKPFIEGEAMYEFVHTLEENGGRTADDGMVRHAAYTAMQCGACGYTYGAQGIWDTVWESKPDHNNAFNPLGITWAQAIEGIGAVQMGYMKEFYLSHDYIQLRPFNACYQGRAFFGGASGFDMFRPLVLANSDMSTVVLYYQSYSRNMPAELCYLKNKPYHVQWFNPRKNEYITLEENMVPAGGKYPVPGRPDGSDWLLVLTCEK